MACFERSDAFLTPLIQPTATRFIRRRARDILKDCVTNGKELCVRDLNLVQGVIDSLHKTGTFPPSLECLLGAFDGMWEYVKSDCISNAIKGAEGIVGVNSRTETVTERKESDDDNNEEEEEEEDLVVDDERLVEKWKQKGFGFLMVHSNKVDRFKELTSVFDKIKVTTIEAGANKVKKAASRPAKLARLTTAGRKTSSITPPTSPKSPTIPLSKSKSPASLTSPAPSANQEGPSTLLWDSSHESSLRSRLLRWAEDALETDSLTAFELAAMWERVEVSVGES